MAGRHSDYWYDNNWWSPEQICREWKREQVEWLLFFLPEALEGYWEKNSDSVTGYIDPSKLAERGHSTKELALMRKTPKRPHKPYKAVKEGISSTATLLEKRLFHCYLDGLFALANITWGISIESLSKVARMSEEEVIKCIDNAIEYVVSYGKRRIK